MLDSFFSTREIALGLVILFLIAISIINCCSKKKTELANPIKQLLVTLFYSKITFILIGIILYAILLNYCLNLLAFWENLYLKDFIMWFLFCGTPAAFKAFNFKENNDVFKIVRENFQWSVVFAFVMSSVTFALYIEIIMTLVFLVLFLLNFVSRSEEQYAPVEKLTKALISIIGIAVFLATVYTVAFSLPEIFNIKTLIVFILPIVLSAVFMPFIYTVALLVSFEMLFDEIAIATQNQCSRKEYLQVIIYSNLSIRKIHLFKKSYLPQLFLKNTPQRLKQALEMYRRNEKCTFEEE